jgi:hypothetical protein
MRYIYSDDEEKPGHTVISDAAENLVDSIAASLMRGDTQYAYLRAQRLYDTAHEAGQQAARKQARDFAEEENRRDAEFGHGKAQFVTKDGLVSHDKLSIRSNEYYPCIWKRACDRDDHVLMDAAQLRSTMATAIQVRIYEFRGEITDRGLPIYREISE